MRSTGWLPGLVPPVGASGKAAAEAPAGGNGRSTSSIALLVGERVLAIRSERFTVPVPLSG